MMKSRKLFGSHCYATSRKNYLAGSVYETTEITYNPNDITKAIQVFEEYFAQACLENGTLESLADIREATMVRLNSVINSMTTLQRQ